MRHVAVCSVCAGGAECVRTGVCWCVWVCRLLLFPRCVEKWMSHAAVCVNMSVHDLIYFVWCLCDVS